MTPREPDDVIRAWFEEGPGRGPEDGLERTLARLAATRQAVRAEVRLPLWLPAAAALSLLLAVVVAFGAGFRIVPPDPRSSPVPTALPATGTTCRLEVPVHGRDAVLVGLGFAPDTDVVLVIDRANGQRVTIDASTGGPRTDRTGGFFLPLRPYPEDLGRGSITATAGCTVTAEILVTEDDLPTPCPDPALAAPPLVDGPAYRAAVAMDAPLAWWSLDDTGDVAVDRTGDHDGTYLGNMRHSVLTPLSDGGAAFFDHRFPGPDTLVAFDPIVLGGDFSVEFWMDFCHWAEADPIVGSFDDAASILLGDGELHLDNGLWEPVWTGRGVVSGAWQHYVVVRSGEDLAIYHNGVREGFEPGAGWTDAFVVSTIGRNSSDNYLGYLDEVALYDHALTPERIASHAGP